MDIVSASSDRRILVTGALGQIGTELVPALRDRYGTENVVASDVRVPQRSHPARAGLFESLDCTRSQQIRDVMMRHRITRVYHLAGLLSAVAENRPQAAWEVNTGGLYRMLEAARENGCALFFPSSIGAFGPQTPKTFTPQETIQRPTTMYGINKVAGELLCDYYFGRFGVDTRGIRLPGIISRTPPGGGTTDYAVEMFYAAVRARRYTCFLRADSACEMMYMPDAIRAMIELMEAEPKRLHHRNAYNVGAMSLTPAQLAREICKHIPAFVVDYEVDPVRQAIADSWPDSMDDRAARSEWDWRPQYDLESLTNEMLRQLRQESRPSLEAEQEHGD